MRIGTFEILPVLDGEMKAPGSAIYPRASADDWQRHGSLLDADGRLTLALGGFLVRDSGGGRTILIDAGLGDFEMGPGRKPGGKLRDSLDGIGTPVGDITDVVFSHLHLDHVGWASQGGVPVFPNATYRCHQADWDYWITGPEEAMHGVSPDFVRQQKDAMLPVADRLETWTADGALFPGFNLQHAPGHTPGSTIFVLSSGNERAVLLGDVAHSPLELLEEEWDGLGDVDPELARRTRNACARQLEGGGDDISGAHFPELAFGRMVKAEGRRNWVAA